MRKLVIVLLLCFLSAIPVQASQMEFTAPTAPAEAQTLLPEEPETFAEGLRSLLKEALPLISPALSEAAGACLRVTVIVLLLGVLDSFFEASPQILRLVGVVGISVTLLQVSRSMIPLGRETVQALSDYGKLLLPVMTASLAAQGHAVTSGALYAGTAFFDALLSSAVSHILIPGVYCYLALSVGSQGTGEALLEKMKDSLKGLVTWGLKTVLYVFTGYMTVSGAISGSADAMALKAAKITVSGMVPVVGGILTDATEAVLVSAGVMRSAAGMYGILAILAVWIGPFIRLGSQYLLLKLTGNLCAIFGSKPLCGIIQDFSAALGLVLAMTAAVGFMLIISTVCFMKVVGV